MAAIITTKGKGWVASGSAFRDVMNRVLADYGEDDEDAETVRVAISVGGISLHLLNPEQAERLARKLNDAAHRIRRETQPTDRSAASMISLMDELVTELRPLLGHD